MTIAQNTKNGAGGKMAGPAAGSRLPGATQRGDNYSDAPLFSSLWNTHETKTNEAVSSKQLR